MSFLDIPAAGLAAGKVPKGERWANVRDYFAANRVEGTTDDRAAFESARLTGRPVYAPAGTYYFSSTPDWGAGSVLVGDGKRKTIFKLLDSAPASATLLGNASLAGTVQGYFADFTLDGNCQRQGGTLVAAGGSRSSTLTFRNVRHFYVDRVESINSIQHGFDVTRGSLDYAYIGDGNLATLRSSDVYFDECEASNFGDDGFTTHSSDFVHFSRCVAYDPRLRDNCNGFEIDGDSRNCTLTNNRTYGCYAGIEVKGHGTESAAQNTIINGHHDTGSVRSYNFRHIGYHSGADPVSLTARNIIATNLVSIGPNNDKGFQDDATPRALAISAYRGVSITGFTAVGRGGYTDGHIAIAVQFRSSEINLSGVNITGWGGAELDLSITSGDRVNVSGLTVWDSARTAIYTGSTVTAVNLSGIIATAPAAGAINGIDIYNASGVSLGGAVFTGYPVPVRADLTDYTSYGHFTRRVAPTPAGLTDMKTLDPAKDYYLTSAQFLACATDRPDGATGGHFVTHSRLSADACTQTLTKNTTGTVIQYFRTLYWASDTASAWHQVTAPAVAYSAT